MADTKFNINTNEYLPLRDVVFNTLRDAILTGKLVPGERLMENQLAEKLGVSRTPVREALRMLELENLGCKLSVGENYLEGVEADVLFRTPGMHPGNPAIEALRGRGAQVTSEMEVFFEVCPCTLLAVTGSDGKTTTTTLVSEMLKAD